MIKHIKGSYLSCLILDTYINRFVNLRVLKAFLLLLTCSASTNHESKTIINEDELVSQAECTQTQHLSPQLIQQNPSSQVFDAESNLTPQQQSTKEEFVVKHLSEQENMKTLSSTDKSIIIQPIGNGSSSEESSDDKFSGFGTKKTDFMEEIKKTLQIYQDIKSFTLDEEISNEIKYEFNLNELMLFYEISNLIRNIFSKLLILNNWRILESKCFKYYFDYKLGLFYEEYRDKWFENKREFEKAYEEKEKIEKTFQDIIKENIIEFTKYMYGFAELKYEIIYDKSADENQTFDAYDLLEKLNTSLIDIKEKYFFKGGLICKGFKLFTKESTNPILFVDISLNYILYDSVNMQKTLDFVFDTENNDKLLKLHCSKIISANVDFCFENAKNNVFYYVFPSKNCFLEHIVMNANDYFREHDSRILNNFKLPKFNREFGVEYSVWSGGARMLYFERINEAYDSILQELKSKISLIEVKNDYTDKKMCSKDCVSFDKANCMVDNETKEKSLNENKEEFITNVSNTSMNDSERNVDQSSDEKQNVNYKKAGKTEFYSENIGSDHANIKDDCTNLNNGATSADISIKKDSQLSDNTQNLNNN